MTRDLTPFSSRIAIVAAAVHFARTLLDGTSLTHPAHMLLLMLLMLLLMLLLILLTAPDNAASIRPCFLPRTDI